jgi:hypothetical protein
VIISLFSNSSQKIQSRRQSAAGISYHKAAALRNPDLSALRRRSQNRGACRQGHAGICIEIARRMRKAFMQKGKRMLRIRFPFFAFCFLRFSALLRVLA